MTQASLDLEPFARRSLTADLAAYFKARPGVWIDMHTLATVAGCGGWRTRLSELRFPPYAMRIENQVSRPRKGFTVSKYRYQP